MEPVQYVLTDSSKDSSVTQTCGLTTASVSGLRRSFLTGPLYLLNVLSVVMFRPLRPLSCGINVS